MCSSTNGSNAQNAPYWFLYKVTWAVHTSARYHQRPNSLLPKETKLWSPLLLSSITANQPWAALRRGSISGCTHEPVWSKHFSEVQLRFKDEDNQTKNLGTSFRAAQLFPYTLPSQLPRFQCPEWICSGVRIVHLDLWINRCNLNTE